MSERKAAEYLAAVVAEQRVRDAAPEMLAALVAVDRHWTEDYPGGPDEPSILHHTTITIWRSIRAAIVKALGTDKTGEA